MYWTRVKDSPPQENGKYLCVNKGLSHRYIIVCWYAKCLSEVDEYDFADKDMPGFYSYDSEYGYYQERFVTHWMPLPDLPEED